MTKDKKSKKTKYVLTPEAYLKKEERRKLLQTCKTHADADKFNGRITWPVRYMLIDLALYSGLRVSEIAELKIKDLHLQDSDDTFLIVRNGKGGLKRTVYIDQYLVKHLMEFIEYKKKTLQESVKPPAPLFAGRGGQHSPTITFMKSFKRAADEAGLSPEYSIHNCRHTYATWLLKDTGDLQYVQQQLGHSKSEITRLYAKILPEDNCRKANQIDRPELEI